MWEARASVSQAREWYDGYRFGDVDVYNPWSVLNYFGNGCAPDVYWGNTSSNSVLGGLVSGADDKMLKRLYALAEPDGAVRAPWIPRRVLRLGGGTAGGMVDAVPCRVSHD